MGAAPTVCIPTTTWRSLMSAVSPKGRRMTCSAPGTRSAALRSSMVVRAADSGRLGGLNSPPNGYSSTWGSFSGMHAPNAAVAEYNGLLDGLPLTTLDPWGAMPRGEVAQVLDNLSR